MIRTPQVSVLIPTYNRARYLGTAVQSVLDQTFGDFELLILDDASTDGSFETLRDLMADRRIVYVRHLRNLGIGANRNSGLARARGEYIAVLDSDDVWLDPSKLQRQVEVLNGDRECGLVGTHARILDQEGRAIGTLRPRSGTEMIHRTLLVRNPFVHSSVLIRKRTLDRTGWYDATLPIWEDYELWLRMGTACTARILPLLLTGYRRHPGNVSRLAKEKSLLSYWQIYRRYRRIYPFGSYLLLKALLLTAFYHLRHPLAGRREYRAR